MSLHEIQIEISWKITETFFQIGPFTASQGMCVRSASCRDLNITPKPFVTTVNLELEADIHSEVRVSLPRKVLSRLGELTKHEPE